MQEMPHLVSSKSLSLSELTPVAVSSFQQLVANTVDMNSLMETVAAFHNYSIPSLFGMFVDADQKNPEVNMLHLWQV